MNNISSDKKPASAVRRTPVPPKKRPLPPRRKPQPPPAADPVVVEEVPVPVRKPKKKLDLKKCLPAFFKSMFEQLTLVWRWLANIFSRCACIIRKGIGFIPAGFYYAVFFLIMAFAVWKVAWTGDGALMMKNIGDLVPVIQKNGNEIICDQQKITMLYPNLEYAQRPAFLEIRKLYKEMELLRETIKTVEDDKEIEKEEKEAKLEAMQAQVQQLKAKILRGAVPISGIEPSALEGLRDIRVRPEVLEVTIAVINVNQGDPQYFTYTLFDPELDGAAGLEPLNDPATLQKYKAQWQTQQKTAMALCHRIHENSPFKDALDEALKQKDAADRAADKIKDEEKRNEIKSKRVEDYFCNSISADEREALECFIGADNKEGENPSADNQHEIEKVYLYVNRIPVSIVVDFAAMKDLAINQAMPAIFSYPVEGFPFARDEVANLQDCFTAVNSKVVTPEEQRLGLEAFFKRDVIAEELERINNNIKLESDRVNRLNLERIENRVQITIAQRPEGMKELTEEGKQSIREQVIKDMNLKTHVPSYRTRESVTVEEMQRWIENALVQEGVEVNNLFYRPLVLEVIRQNNSTARAEAYLSGSYANVVGILMLLCALGALAAGIGNVIDRLRTKKGISPLLADNPKIVLGYRIAHYCIIAGLWIFFIYWFLLYNALCDIPDQILKNITDNELFLAEEKTLILLHYFGYWISCVILWAIAIFACHSAGVKSFFCKTAEEGAVYRYLCGKSEKAGMIRVFYVVLVVFVVWIVWPYMSNFRYIGPLKNPFAPMLDDYIQQDAYLVPAGGGDQVASKPVVVKKKKKKKVKKYIVNPRTSIIFDIPDLNDEEHLQEIDEATETQYTTGSMFGKGKNKGKPGWAGGMENGKIRFIRLQYSGDNWDWNMGKGSDYNMLIYLRDQVGFKIANDTESVTVNKLARGFRKGKKPPFIYLTGRGSINLSATEVKQLNEYLLKDGGMIFADNAGGNFDHHFRAMIKRVLPNHKLVEIANDDPIYTAPYFFPNGAPRFFHHSHDSRGALGIKNNGRWVVFYHQGDIGDAWKGAGLTEQQRTDAFKMGANVISYAFGAYLENLSQE